MNLHESRSASPARAPELPGACPEPMGVGARQGHFSARQGGGGYLNECTSSEFLELAKIQEFEKMGLPAVWIRVAQDIGYDAFLRVWRILDTSADHGEVRLSDSGAMILASLRRYSSYKRYQRNRWIEELSSRGLKGAAIQCKVKEKLGESIQLDAIYRIAKGRKEK
jgi:hypothetical protein